MAKDPDGRRFQVTILRKGPHEMHCVELAFFHGFRDSGDFVNVTPLYGSMQSETVGFGHHAVLLLECSQDGARKPILSFLLLLTDTKLSIYSPNIYDLRWIETSYKLSRLTLNAKLSQDFKQISTQLPKLSKLSRLSQLSRLSEHRKC